MKKNPEEIPSISFKEAFHAECIKKTQQPKHIYTKSNFLR